MKLYFKIIIAFLSIVLLQACPTQMVKSVRNFENKLDSAKKMKRVYKIGRKKYQDLAQKRVQELKDSITSLDESFDKAKLETALSQSDIKLDIINIDKSHYPDSVSLYLQLVDESGNNITGLGKPYLADSLIHNYWKFISDNCISSSVVYDKFNVEEIRLNSSPKSAVSYVLDYSGSMPTPIINALRNGIRKMINHTKKGDKIALTVFSDTFIKEIQLTENLDFAKAVVKADTASIPREGTELVPPMIATIEDLAKSEVDNRTLILFSDGFSLEERDTIVSAAIKNKVKIFAVSYYIQGSDIDFLEKLTSSTGGKSYQIISQKEIPYIFAEIYLSLNNYYKITYKPGNCNGLHNVFVDLNLPEFYKSMSANGEYLIPVFEEIISDKVIELDINFASGSNIIDKESKMILDKIIPQMKAYSNFSIEITGHTDDVGSEEDNQILSERRAESVLKYLKEQGIDKNRMSSRGVGETEHIAPNDTPENRRKNRRTEIRFTQK